MDLTLAYLGKSELKRVGNAEVLAFAPNLTRDRVSFDGALRYPLRFREAISALHDVVISDLRFKPKDKSAYKAWKAEDLRRQQTLRRHAFEEARKQLHQEHGITPEKEQHYASMRTSYWRARLRYSRLLMRQDPRLWRMLMPCDPVVTVAEDVTYFECFSADESSYGCLTLDRDGGFSGNGDAQFGTTNVDYSWALYEQFQKLRSYRATRLAVDPSGFEVATDQEERYREEKIDLPDGWLRGFMQLQGAMGLPMRRVTVSRDAVYSILAWHKRHRARRSPRAMRWELVTGQPPQVVLEPWEKRIVSHGTPYTGTPCEPIRIWGTRRLQVLARLLPLADQFDVYLLGTGFPSFWVVTMGEMRLTLGLSGWTANDWTRGSALDLLAPPEDPDETLVLQVAAELRSQRALSLESLRRTLLRDPSEIAASLRHLAHTGQAIYDLGAGLFRWRQIMPMVLGEAQLGPENEELVASRRIRRVRVENESMLENGMLIVQAEVEKLPVEIAIDRDGGIRRGKCKCRHHYRAGLKNGPCRHLLAVRQWVLHGKTLVTGSWYDRLLGWAEN